MTVTTDAPRDVNTDPHLTRIAEYMVNATSTDMPGYHPAAWDRSYHDAIRSNIGPLMEYLLDHGTFDRTDGQIGVRMCEILGGSGFAGGRRLDADAGFEQALGRWARTHIVLHYLNEKYPVGSRWTFVGHDSHNSSIPEGATVERADEPFRIGFLGYSPCVYVGTVGEDDRPRGSLHVGPENLRPLHSTVESLAVDVIDRTEHERLLATRDARITEMESTIAAYWADAETVSRMILAAADANGFCSVYDETVEEINTSTRFIKLETRREEHEFNATRRVRVSTWVTQHGTYSGTNDEPDEDDFSWTDLDTDDVVRAVRSDWDEDGDTEDFEYE